MLDCKEFWYLKHHSDTMIMAWPHMKIFWCAKLVNWFRTIQARSKGNTPVYAYTWRWFSEDCVCWDSGFRYSNIIRHTDVDFIRNTHRYSVDNILFSPARGSRLLDFGQSNYDLSNHGLIVHRTEPATFSTAKTTGPFAQPATFSVAKSLYWSNTAQKMCCSRFSLPKTFTNLG